MRLVADTNTVISGLLWHGAPRRLLDAARAGKVSHLLNLKTYQDIPILTVNELLALLPD